MTTIQDVITFADGTLPNGRVVVTWPAFQQNGSSVAGGQQAWDIVNGVIDITLYANANASPIGVYYTAVYELNEGALYPEYWIIPNLPVVNLGQIKVGFPITPSAIISARQLTSAGATYGQFLGWDGTHWVPMYVTTINISPNTIGMAVSANAAPDLGITGSPAALGGAMILNVPDAGLTSRGVVTTGTQTFAGQKTFQGLATFAGGVTITGPSSIAGYVPATRQVLTGNGLAGGGSLAADLTLTAVNNTSVQKVQVNQNSTLQGTRHALNFIAGANVTLAVADNPSSDWVDVQFSSTGNVPAGTNTGDILFWTSVPGPGAWTTLPKGPAGQVLTASATTVNWAAAAAAPVTSVFTRTGAIVAQAGDYSAFYVPISRQVNTGSGLTGGGALSADLTLSVLNDTTTQRVQAALAGTLAGTRPELNFIAGSGQTINITDNPGSNRLDITISASGTGPATPSIYSVDGAVIGTRSELNLITGTNVTLAGVDNSGANRVDITITASGGGAVASVFGRSGAVVAQTGDYTAAQVTNAVSVLGSYADPAWITSLAYGKLTGVPSVSSMQTPWLSNINAAGFNLNSVGAIGIGVASSTATRIFVQDTSNNPQQMYLASLSSPGAAGITLSNDASVAASVFVGGSTYANSGFRSALVLNTQTAFPIVFGTQSTERMRITAAGLVGLGTASPGYMLDVNGDCNLSAGSVYRINGVPLSTGGGFWVGGTGGAIYYNGGNVGIGTTSPQVLLQARKANSSIAPTGNIFIENSGGAAYFEAACAAVGDSCGYLFSSGASLTSYIIDLANNWQFVTSGSRAIEFLAGGAERMRITSAGSVGIGTTSPSSMLSVVSPASIDGVTISSYNRASIWLNTTNNSNYNWLIQSAVSASSDLQILASTAPSVAPTKNIMTLLTSGNVGIGTTGPSALLSVNTPPAGNAANCAMFSQTADGTAIIINRSGATNTMELWLGVNQTSLYSEIQGARAGVGFTSLILNRQGGNVGIGTTNPRGVLDVTAGIGSSASYMYFTGNASGVLPATGQVALTWNASGGGAEVALFNCFVGASSSFRFSQLTSASAATTLMTIQANGNVGIGTTSPAVKFQVSDGSNHSLMFIPGTTNTIQSMNDTGGAWVPMQILAVNNLYLNPTGGNVGIGTANPVYPLDVAGNINASGDLSCNTLQGTAGHSNCVCLRLPEGIADPIIPSSQITFFVNSTGTQLTIFTRHSDGAVRRATLALA